MIFDILRKYFRDDKFEQTKTELTETRQLLKEYKEFLTQIQNKDIDNNVEKVDPDFINLMWASVGIALAIFISTGKKVLELQDQMDKPEVYIWVILATFSLYFVIANGYNIIKLTKKYVDQKEDPAYKNYEWYLRVGGILIFLAALALAFLDS